MMEMAKVTSKGQITIPISIRRRLGINEGDKLLFISKPDGVMMVNPDMLESDQVEAMVEAAESPTAVPAVAAVPVAPAIAATPATPAAPAAPIAPAAAAVKREAIAASPQAPVRSDESMPAADSITATESAAVTESAAAAQSVDAPQSAAAAQEVRRPMPPPVYEPEPEKPAARVGGLDLTTLLDDIRNIGSNI